MSLFKDVQRETQHLTTHEFLIAQAKHFDSIGLTDYLINGISGEKLAYNDVEEKSRRIASYLYKKGLRKGDIVIYMTSYQLHQIPLMMGVWRANGIMRSLYIDESVETIVEKVKESNCRWIFCDTENGKLCQSVRQKCGWPIEVVICGGELEELPHIADLYNDSGDKCPATEVELDDIALILPTSGTTGSSKGSAHTHKSVMKIIQNWALFPFHVSKPNLSASKGTHISGALLPFSLLIKGLIGVLLPKVTKEIIIQTVDKYKPGFVFAFPTFLIAMGSSDANGYDMSSVEIVLAAGSPLTTEMQKAYMAISPNMKAVLNGYGLTEGGSVSTNVDLRESPEDCPMGSTGKPFLGVEIQIRDLETLQPVVGPNLRGEVCVKGDFLLKEYYKDPEKTKEAFIDGFFRTGDVGYLDDNGYLFLVDRSKEIFKYYHNHISPTEIEGIVCQHPAVEEICVVGIVDEGGHVPRAFVTLKNPNVFKNFRTIGEEIKSFTNDQLASYKQLRGGVFIVNELPKGKTGKVVRNLVSQMELPKY